MTSMTPERWREVESLFEACLDLDAEARRTLLDRRVDGDPELRREVEALLAHAEPDRRLERIVESSRDAALAGSERSLSEHAGSGPSWGRQPGERIGDYRLVECLGEGGMGSVWRARRADDEFEQEVAIKFVGAARLGRGWNERFRVERQILARLEHPHIARLLGGGATDEGEPYLVMEKVEGEGLLAYCDSRHLGIADRLQLFLKMASAVEHAHRHLVVHRDLKPANVLVHPESGPKLLDFGIAKILRAEDGPEGDAAPPDPTVLEERLLTPDYASPEQVLGRPVTTASDVYSLGVLLFELLTGQRPRRLQTLTPAERERELTGTLPFRPSTLVERAVATGSERAAALRGLDSSQLARSLRGDLDTIALRALQTDPERRYGSVAELAADVRRYLAGEPVLARPDSFNYRVGKLVRRHPWGTAAVVLIAVLIAAVVAGLAVHTDRVEAERDRALAAESEARQVSDFLMHLFEVADPGESRGETVTARELLDRGSELIETNLEDQPEVQTSLLSTLGEVHRALGLYARAEALHRLALERRRDHLGEEHPASAESHDRLGDTLRELGRFDDAEAELRWALSIRTRRLPPDDPALGDSLNNLGLLLLERDRLDDAEPMLRRALAIREARLGAEHPDTVVSKSNLGQLLGDSRRFDEASLLMESVLESRVRRLGENHPKVANAFHNLGSLRHEQGRYDEAETALRRALRIRREVLPPYHSHTAATINNLASLLHDRMRLSEAEAFYREALEFDRQSSAFETIFHAYTLNNLGSLLEDLGRYDEAEALYRRSLELRAEKLGEDSHSYRRMLSSMGRLALRAGDLDLAEERLRRADAWFRDHLDPDDPDRIRNLERSALLLRARGDAEAGARMLEEALGLASRTFGEDHGVHPLLQAELAVTLARSDHPERCRAAVDAARTEPGYESGTDLTLGRVELAAGLCAEALGRHEEAEASLRRAVELMRPSLGDGNHWVREALSRL